jgi:signal-transduction protein with cAMP-binding, CBS, and nucleotidyltransferase domain
VSLRHSILNKKRHIGPQEGLVLADLGIGARLHEFFLFSLNRFRHILAPALLRSEISEGGEPMHVDDLINAQQTHRADSSQTVLEVAQAMVERNIGAVPVVRDGLLIGIFSERDLMRRVVVEGRDPRTTRVDEVMTEDPLTVCPGESLETCMLLMRRHGFRHLPVCEGRELRGIVSLRDILLHDLNEKDHEVRMMRAYIQASPEL